MSIRELGTLLLVIAVSAPQAAIAGGGRFTPGPPLQIPRAGPAVVVTSQGQDVFVIGGENLEGPLRSAEYWNDGQWSSLGKLNVPRVWHTATALDDDDRVLVAGGGGADARARFAELWDGEKFRFAGRMRANRRRHTATLLADGRVLVIGGRDLADRPLASAEIWDPADEKWHSTGRMKQPRCCHTATRLLDGRVLVLGGLTLDPDCRRSRDQDCLSSTNTAEIWNPKSGRFTAIESLPEDADRAAHTATLLRDGRVLVAGGAHNDVTDEPSYEDFLFDPKTGRFRPLPPVKDGPDSLGRPYHTATLLPDGRVLAVGGAFDLCGCCKITPGRHRDDFQREAMLWDPTTETWTRIGPTVEPRARQGAAELPDGRVLIIGGQSTVWGSTSDVFASTEIWEPEPERTTPPARRK